MATRKLILFGKNSYVISIPKLWVEQNKLEKGSEINLDESGNSLVISSTESKMIDELKIKKILLDNTTRSIKRNIIEAYINNYNIIEINGTNLNEHIQIIEETTHSLVALEIMEQTQKKVIIKDFLNIDDVSIDNIVKRMDIIIRTMLSDTEADLKENKKIDLYKRDTDINRLFYVGQKIINKILDNPGLSKKLNLDLRDTLYYWKVIDNLEKVADKLKRFTKLINKLHEGCLIKEKLIVVFSKLIKEYIAVMKSLYSNDKSMADKLLERKKSILQELDNISELNNVKDKHILNVHNINEVIVIIERLKRFERCIGNLAKAIINKE